MTSLECWQFTGIQKSPKAKGVVTSTFNFSPLDAEEGISLRVLGHYCLQYKVQVSLGCTGKPYPKEEEKKSLENMLKLILKYLSGGPKM